MNILAALLACFVLVLPSQVSADTRQGRAHDWGPWTAWSVCSETCGYGTAYRIRQCHAKLRYGRDCSGPSKQYQICKTRICADGTVDYRTRECANNNNVYYGRRRYSWIPYINDQAPCELSCKSEGFGYYARFKKTVVDGVICNEENTAVCMQGRCVESGCDGVLGSGTDVDRCGKCGGDGSTCRPISAIFTRTHLTHRGYNVVTTIPAGACSINVTEMRRSKNHLALSTPSGYFLNGDMRLQSEGKVKGAGTIFTYSRSSGPDCPGECLTAPGPLNTSLRVELIYFGRNPGIFYHFTVPRDSDYRDAVDSRAAEPSAADDRRHHGHHRRRHHRRHRGDRPEHTSAHEGVPQADVIPAVSQGTSPLHLRRRQHRRQPLRTSHRPSVILRSSYQRPDGKGTHGSASRDRDDDDNTDSRDTRQNSRRPTKKASPPRSYIQIKSKSRLRNKQAPISSKKTPSDSQNQQGAAAPGKSGVGYEQGQFFVKGENGSIQYKHYYHTNVHDGLGDVPIGSANGDEKTSQGSVRYGQKPTRIDSSYDDRYAEFRATTQYQPSSRASIPNVISASLTPQAGVVAAPPRARAPPSYPARAYDGYDNRVSGYSNERHLYSWRISGFTPCSEPCGGGLQETRVVCVKSDSQVEVIEENCDSNTKPESTTIVCNNQPCEAGWALGEWSECSVTCGRGLQKRTVECKQRISPTLTIAVSSSNCPHPRPQTRQYCQRDPCHVWKVGNWSKCSSECGFGQRTRDVTCVDTEESEVSVRLCSAQVKPSVEEICDMGSCAQGWFHTKWSKECSVECGRGHYVRQVYCSAADGSPLAEHKCGGKDSKPKEKKKCKSSKPCGGLWFAGPWSKCNSTCGSDAYREREVLCVKRHGKRLNHVVKGHNCEKEKKPQSREWCGPLATCKPQWYMTAWSECSKSCGTGVRTREAKCLDSTLTASPDCDKSHKPNRRQSCNKQPCPDGFAEFSETPAASQNEALQMDGSSAASKVDDVSECSDQQSSSWCYMASQARLCTIPYYKDMCCLTCRKMLPKPH